MAPTPIVYLLHGEDEAAMREAVASMQSKLGEASTVDMNTARFDTAPSIDALRNASMAAPFLSERRMVIVRGAAKAFGAADAKERFTQLLDELPLTTAFVILENPALESKHWLHKWSKVAGERAMMRQFDLPKGAQMANWLRERAKALGGDLEPAASAALATQVGSDKTAAENEIEKLLAHAGYARAVTAADVAELALPVGEQGDFFALIDALSAGNGAKAMQMLQALMPERDLIMLYFSLVSHFRLLLQTSELVATGRSDAEVAKTLGIHPYRAEKMAAQSKRFTIETLKAIYRRLLVLDEQIKTGEIEAELAMETFVASLSAQTA
jgi:DNA polymerase-3 subunit delta